MYTIYHKIKDIDETYRVLRSFNNFNAAFKFLKDYAHSITNSGPVVFKGKIKKNKNSAFCKIYFDYYGSKECLYDFKIIRT